MYAIRSYYACLRELPKQPGHVVRELGSASPKLLADLGTAGLQIAPQLPRVLQRLRQVIPGGWLTAGRRAGEHAVHAFEVVTQLPECLGDGAFAGGHVP